MLLHCLACTDSQRNGSYTWVEEAWEPGMRSTISSSWLIHSFQFGTGQMHKVSSRLLETGSLGWTEMESERGASQRLSSAGPVTTLYWAHHQWFSIVLKANVYNALISVSWSEVQSSDYPSIMSFSQKLAHSGWAAPQPLTSGKGCR